MHMDIPSKRAVIGRAFFHSLRLSNSITVRENLVHNASTEPCRRLEITAVYRDLKSGGKRAGPFAGTAGMVRRRAIVKCIRVMVKHKIIEIDTGAGKRPELGKKSVAFALHFYCVRTIITEQHGFRRQHPLVTGTKAKRYRLAFTYCTDRIPVSRKRAVMHQNTV